MTCTVFEIFEMLSLEGFSGGAHFRDPAQIYEIDDITQLLSLLKCPTSTYYEPYSLAYLNLVDLEPNQTCIN